MVHNTYEIAPVSLRVSFMEKKAKKIVLRGYYWEKLCQETIDSRLLWHLLLNNLLLILMNDSEWYKHMYSQKICKHFQS